MTPIANGNPNTRNTARNHCNRCHTRIRISRANREKSLRSLRSKPRTKPCSRHRFTFATTVSNALLACSSAETVRSSGSDTIARKSLRLELGCADPTPDKRRSSTPDQHILWSVFGQGQATGKGEIETLLLQKRFVIHCYKQQSAPGLLPTTGTVALAAGAAS